MVITLITKYYYYYFHNPYFKSWNVTLYVKKNSKVMKTTKSWYKMHSNLVWWLGLDYKEFGKSFVWHRYFKQGKFFFFIHYLCLYECDTNFKKQVWDERLVSHYIIL